MSINPGVLNKAVHEALPIAAQLFVDLRGDASASAGVNRDTYGAGEQSAHDLVCSAGRTLGLETDIDFAGNLYLTLPGRDRAAPAWMTGSHLDSVPDGGNYDGAAGVVAGLTAIAALRCLEYVPQRDITVIGIRAEEASSWYEGDHGGHIGSRAALGHLRASELASASHILSGLSLYEGMRTAGFDPRAIELGQRFIDPARCRGFVELHIEQGPVMVERSAPVGIVTGIRGSSRARTARCIGEYAHSGAVPHEYRRDAVLATAEFCHAMDQTWTEFRENGNDLVLTVGRLFTDMAAHSITKVPGEVNFSIDIRSEDRTNLLDMTRIAETLAAEIGQRRRVQIALGKFNISEPTTMDLPLRQSLQIGSEELGLSPLLLPSGAGHDAQEFAAAGIPTAMIFVRNDHGSHNPGEAMSLDDFALGTELLAWQLIQ